MAVEPLVSSSKIHFFLGYVLSIGEFKALYKKNMFDYFNHNDPNTLEIINQAADGGHIGASYALDIISIFKGGESMRQGLMFIANMKKMETLILRRCRQKLRYVLGEMWVSEPYLLGDRPIYCTIHQHKRVRCELCSFDLELDYCL
ncbi:hypothetical protein H5410_061548 [Solanum commersonii]|uniref:At2g35280-like TPR domain-containing protein n=1 Tax=Solanum commersonii TaxID=4109 RepID=A0A9J5W9Z2_SOLCO|nr:hypothetical protein H5410_061548 [Solanum commersonii]